MRPVAKIHLLLTQTVDVNRVKIPVSVEAGYSGLSDYSLSSKHVDFFLVIVYVVLFGWWCTKMSTLDFSD